MRTERGQRVAAAWAVRGQPYPAVGAAWFCRKVAFSRFWQSV